MLFKGRQGRGQHSGTFPRRNVGVSVTWSDGEAIKERLDATVVVEVGVRNEC